MNTNHRIQCAVAAVLAASASEMARAAAPAADTTTESTGISEVVVTAQRKSENIQDVPITIQALTAETISQLKVATFDDVVKYLPNVTTGTYGPGQNIIFMRGLGTGALGVQGEGSVGIFPNVAVYLDEQSAQLPSRNLDVYAVDLERIEVLEGPQGTLFGAGAEAGVIRYITNKPKLNVEEGNVNASYGTVAGGDPNTAIDAMINLPLIEDKLAVRGVVYNDTRGGYINNVPATFARSGWDLGLATHNCPPTVANGCLDTQGRVTTPGIVPGGPGSPAGSSSEVINNYLETGNNINQVTYQGVRASALWQINDKWDALLTQTYQNMNAQGVAYEMPSTGGGKYGPTSAYFNPQSGYAGGTPLPSESVSLFTPSYNKDKFTNTAWVVDGQVSFLKLVYDGAYLVRNVEQQSDYTNYARGLWGYYYQCSGYSVGFDPPFKCYSPRSTWTDTERLVHWDQELRLSTPQDLRVRGLLGFYYEKYSIYDNTEWLYRSLPECPNYLPTGTGGALQQECYLPVQPWPGAPANQPGVRNSQTGFFDDVQRGYKQKAVFASIDVDIIPKVLTVTGGTRYFKFNEWANGGDVGSFYCKMYSGYYTTTNYGPCTAGKPPLGNNNGANHQFYKGPPFYNPNNQSGGSAYGPYGTNLTGSTQDESGTRSRANLSWHVKDDMLLYYTFSQGYRPGGFNRGSSGHIPANYQQGLGESTKCGYKGKPACQFYTPLTWSSDNLINNELGWKTEWLDHKLLFNGALYQEKWNNVQTSFFDPQGGLGNLTFNTNGPDYKVKGVEIQLIYQPIRGLTFTGSGAWNSSEQTNSPALINNNPYCTGTASINNPGGTCTGYNQAITGVQNPYGSYGSRLAMSPAFEGNMRARYEWTFNSYASYVQAGANHIGETISQTGNVSPFMMPGYTTYDASAGIGKDAWIVEFYGVNITNVLASMFTSSNQFVVTETTVHPRVLGVKFSYAFKGH